MNRTASTLVISVAILGLVVVLLAGAGLRIGGTSGGDSGAVVSEGPRLDPPPDGSHGLVYGTHKAESGLGLFGWQIISPRYVAQVGFVPPPGCEAPTTGELVPDGPCARVPAWGEVSGGGTTADGHDLVIVSVTVSERCHEVLRAGDRWPSADPACADD